ncbi:MAG: undecaprenyl-diphosphate phosphatase [Candidatus Aenigmatarchaeota archaeon]
MEFLQAAIIGFLQGIFEWLPVSSEGVVTLAMTNIFGESALASVNVAIWLHLGTLFAALLYFRDDFKQIVLGLPDYFTRSKYQDSEERKLISFLIVTTLITGIIGGVIYLYGLQEIAQYPKLFTGLMGLALLGTGLLRFYSGGERSSKTLGHKDSILTGIMQSLSVLPGVSRSGSTVFALFYRKFEAKEAFRLSFLLSVPAVLIANIGIQLFSEIQISTGLVFAALVSFLVGYFTIDLILKIAERTEVAYLCFALAILTFLSLLI